MLCNNIYDIRIVLQLKCTFLKSYTMRLYVVNDIYVNNRMWLFRIFYFFHFLNYRMSLIFQLKSKPVILVSSIMIDHTSWSVVLISIFHFHCCNNIADFYLTYLWPLTSVFYTHKWCHYIETSLYINTRISCPKHIIFNIPHYIVILCAINVRCDIY